MRVPRLLSLNTYNYRRGGSDVVFLEHDAMFKALGWETGVMTMHHPMNESSPWSRFFADEIEFDHQYAWLDKIIKASKVIYSFEAKRKIGQLLDLFPADIAHAHCLYHHLSPSVLSELKSRGIPTVMTAHDLKLACPAYKMLNRDGICEKCRSGNLLHVIKNRCIKESLSASGLVMIESSVHKLFKLYRRNLDKIIAPSKFYHHKLQEWGWSPAQIIHIPNHINAECYIPNYQHSDYFFYFGRLAAEKGVATLIRAAAQAKVKLRIAGTGPEADFLQRLAVVLQSDVEFLGFVSGEPLKILIRDARAVVLPSEWYENAPMSILEAYASGTPVLGACIGGIPEMLQDGETGALFESGNAQQLAALLSSFQALPNNKISSMGKTARDYVASTFNSERYIQAMLNLYSELGVHLDLPKERL
jgi:glycosyltransferase involved in cell wall biosynthesis